MPNPGSLPVGPRDEGVLHRRIAELEAELASLDPGRKAQAGASPTVPSPIDGGGEMGALMRSIDWSATPLGPVESWSPALRMVTSFLLANRFPMLVWWGPQFCQIYNDPYRPVLGTKHPQSMGQPGSECWAEIWHIIGPLAETPFQGGPATWMDDIELEINRHGFVEETHFTIAYSAVPDETVPGRIGGVLATVHEIGEKVVGERRILLLRDLGFRSAEAKTAEEACAIAAATVAQYPSDIPFALIYLIDADRKRANLAGIAGVDRGEAASPATIELAAESQPAPPWPLAQAAREESMQLVENLAGRLPAVPPGPWSDPPSSAVVLPIRSNMAHQLAGFLVLGISSRLRFDDSYRGFCDLVTSQVATAIANARAYEEERKRAEALAEIDRAKTAFFSNVSHEFRTPLALMIGPLEDMLRQANGRSAESREQLDLVHRNAVRLLKLVNTLLNFSRIQSGRAQASYEPTDLAMFTADLCSVFRSAIEKAGLRLTLDTPPLREPVYVDRSMWEKIVLNLMSNAFKFTFKGEIAVSLRQVSSFAELSIRDTGTGIPEHERSRVFDRFHRVEGAQGRSYEGSGIGLALVRELIEMHGGTVRVDSVYGAGSTFTVSIPLGSAHLPSGSVSAGAAEYSMGPEAHSYSEEALSWLPDNQAAVEGAAPYSGTHEAAREGSSNKESAAATARILIADDNADMRLYLKRLLSKSYRVEAVGNGEAALNAIRENPPDLLLTDVMMPRLDGFGLLKALRGNAATKTLPVIMLSARAGGERQIEGLEAGADDYLVKPFSASEVLARVSSHLEISRVRRDAIERQRLLRKSAEQAERLASAALAQLQALFDQAPIGIYLVDADLRLQNVNPIARPVFGNIGNLSSRDFPEVIHILWRSEYADEIVSRFRHTLETGEPYFMAEHAEERRDSGIVEYYQWQINRVVLPDGRFGVVCYFTDISAHVLARQALAASGDRLRFMAESMPQKIFTATPAGGVDYCNRQWMEFAGLSFDEIKDWDWVRLMHPDDAEETLRSWKDSMATGEAFQCVHRFRRADGAYRWHLSRALAMRNSAGQISMWIGSNTDIHDQKEMDENLRQTQKLESLGVLAGGIAHDFNNLLVGIMGNASLAADLVKPADPVQPLLKDVIEASERAAALTRQMLAYSGRGSFNIQPMDVSVLIRSVVNLLRSSISRTIELKLDLAEDRLFIQGDESQIQQVLMNLVINGAEAIEGVGTVRVRTRAQTLEETGSRSVATGSGIAPGSYVCIEVADTGSGIEEAAIARIFDPFFTTKFTGRGLGLAAVSGIVRGHKGSIRVETELGKGTTFTVLLPALGKAGYSATPAVPELSAAPGSGTVLIVDDEAVVRRTAAASLRKHGYSVLLAENGIEAVRVFEQSADSIDAVLLDMTMPQMSGEETLHRLATIRPNVKVILSSGFSEVEAARRFKSQSLAGFLQKPYTAAELAHKVGAVLEHRRQATVAERQA